MGENNSIHIRTIAKIYNGFKAKFGVPWQSGLVDDVESKIIFEPEFRNKDAVRGLEEYSHLWLIWHFSESDVREWKPTVRPPKLGGNAKVGVFASRSPYRPNPLGLSCVTLKRMDLNADNGPVLYVSGADLLDGTQIFDIKPYLPYTDAKLSAKSGFAVADACIEVDFPDSLLEKIDINKRTTVKSLLAQDPRPGYQDESERIYGMTYENYNIRFNISENMLHVLEVDLL